MEKQVPLHLEHVRPSLKLGSLSTPRRHSSPCCPPLGSHWHQARHLQRDTSKNVVPGSRPSRAHGPKLRRVTVAFDTTPIHAYPKVLLNPIVLPPAPRARAHFLGAIPAGTKTNQALCLAPADSPPPRGPAVRTRRAHMRGRGRRARGAYRSRFPSTAKYISQNACAAARHMRSERPGARGASGRGAPDAGTALTPSHPPPPTLRLQTLPPKRPRRRD